MATTFCSMRSKAARLPLVLLFSPLTCKDTNGSEHGFSFTMQLALCCMQPTACVRLYSNARQLCDLHTNAIKSGASLHMLVCCVPTAHECTQVHSILLRQLGLYSMFPAIPYVVAEPLKVDRTIRQSRTKPQVQQPRADRQVTQLCSSFLLMPKLVVLVTSSTSAAQFTAQLCHIKIRGDTNFKRNNAHSRAADMQTEWARTHTMLACEKCIPC